MEKQNEPDKIIVLRVDSWLRFSFWLILVVALGLLAVNQGMKFFYGAHLLKSPCNLCADLNPEVKSCIYELEKQSMKFLYWTPEGYKENIGNLSYNVSQYG